MEQKKRQPLGVCLSSNCNRNCLHCADNADMNGRFFSKQNALHLAEAINRTIYTMRRKMNLGFSLDFTGKGELLLNPDLMDIMDILFLSCPDLNASLVTSGIDPKAPEEEARLKMLLSGPYAKNIDFYVSFNLYEKRFPKRLIKTLALLFQSGVNKVFIKVCQPANDILRPIRKLDWLIYQYFVKWVKEVDAASVLSNTAFWPCNVGNGVEDMISYFFLVGEGKDDEKIKEAIALRCKHVFVDSERLALGGAILETDYCQNFRFNTKFGEKEIVYKPHYLSKRGRAKNLKDRGWPPNELKCFCSYLMERENTSKKMHLSPDGFYYPDVACPYSEYLKLGHVSEDFRVVLGRFLDFRKILLECIIADKHWYDNTCEHCLRVAERLGILPLPISRNSD